MRDPSSWIDAEEMESFLNIASNHFSNKQSTDNLAELVGHDCLNLHSWGVLDSVLRMMDKPLDIYLHPERLLSYFISPSPPLLRLDSPATEDLEKSSFEISISSFDYPLTTKYLQTALEALPTFFGRENAQVQWIGKVVDINWETRQDSLFELGQLKKAADGRLVGQLQPSGELPSFMDEIEANRIPFPKAKFNKAA